MFIYPETEPNRLGTATRWDVPLNTWLGVKFGLGRHDTAGGALGRLREDLWASGPEISAEEANEKYGITGEGGLKFDAPISEGRAKLMKQRKEEELLRMSYLNAAEHSWLSPKAAAGLGAQLVGGLAHPVDALLMFAPFVGSTAKATGLAKLGAGPVRQAIARGLVPMEAIPTFAKLPRLGPLFVEGVMQNAVAEIPVYLQNVRDQAIYGPVDAAFNVVAGGAFAAGLHAAGRAIMGLSMRTKELMFRKAAQDFLDDKPPDIDGVARMDEGSLRMEAERAIDAEDAARQPIRTGPVEMPWDIVQEITENIGGIRGKKHARAGSEGFYTEAYNAISKTGIGRKLFSERGSSPDEIVDTLRRQGVMPENATVDDLWDEIEAAIQARRTLITGQTPEQRAVRFYNALEAQAAKKTAHVVTVSDLNVGDAFTLAGEKFRVTAIDPDDGSVTVQDGKKFGAQTLPEGAELAIDARSLQQTPGGLQARLATAEFATKQKREQRIREWIAAKKAEGQREKAEQSARAEQAVVETAEEELPVDTREAIAKLEQETAELEAHLRPEERARLEGVKAYISKDKSISAAGPCVLQAISNP